MICCGDKKCYCKNCAPERHRKKRKPKIPVNRPPVPSVYRTGLSGFADAWDENPPAEFH